MNRVNQIQMGLDHIQNQIQWIKERIENGDSQVKELLILREHWQTKYEALLIDLEDIKLQLEEERAIEESISDRQK